MAQLAAAVLAQDVTPIFVITGVLLVAALLVAGLVHVGITSTIDAQARMGGLRRRPDGSSTHGDHWRP